MDRAAPFDVLRRYLSADAVKRIMQALENEGYELVPTNATQRMIEAAVAVGGPQINAPRIWSVMVEASIPEAPPLD